MPALSPALSNAYGPAKGLADNLFGRNRHGVCLSCFILHDVGTSIPIDQRLSMTRMRLLILSSVLLVAACGGGGSSPQAVDPPPQDRPASVERDVQPTATNPSVDTSLEPHVAINPSADVAPANKLFVFLPGTDGIPDMYRFVLRAGASRGYHALGLNYPNPLPVGILCLNQDENCFWNVRREIITGMDHSDLVDVDEANAVIGRLADTIAYLHGEDPDQGWGQFLDNGAVDWSKIVVAGHSQGGGHAGVMAKLYSMNRVVYFASPADWDSQLDEPAEWTSRPNVTPASRQFGFTHVDDTLVPYDQLLAIWDSMGVSGSPVSVDSAAAPFSGSHLLTTDADPSPGSPTHSATVRDAGTPLDGGGAPVYETVWDYLCFE